MQLIAQSKIHWKLLSIVMILVVVGGFFAWQKGYLPKNPFLQTTKNQNETTNWQTYRNEEFGFEIKYPKDWEVDNYGFHNTSCDSNHLSGVNCSIDFTVEQNPNLISADQWIDDNLYYLYFPRDKKPFIVGDTEGIKAHVTLIHMYEGVMVVFARGKLIYQFNAGTETEPILNQMLSTFKFIE